MARFELAPLELTLGAVDGTAPDQDTPVDFKASIGRYSRIAFAGALRPVAEQAYVNGEGSLTDIDMISLDGFARRAIGYSIESGTLSADLRVELQQQQLDSAADLTIRKLEIDPLKPDQQDEFSTELGVPLGVALSLLQDDQETIQLERAIEGRAVGPLGRCWRCAAAGHEQGFDGRHADRRHHLFRAAVAGAGGDKAVRRPHRS